MTAQIILNIASLAILVLFSASFTFDLISTVFKAWNGSKSITDLTPTPIIETILQLPEPWQMNTENIEVISIESKQSLPILRLLPPAKSTPIIDSMPQTPEAKALEQWLSVAPANYGTPRPKYSDLIDMTVKQLRQEAKIRTIKNSGSMTKNKLISALLAA